MRLYRNPEWEQASYTRKAGLKARLYKTRAGLKTRVHVRHFAGAGAGAAGAGAGVVDGAGVGVAAGGVVPGSAGAGVVAGAVLGGRPPTTDPGPLCPMMPSTRAPTTKITAPTVVARDSTVAPLRAPKAAWLAPPPKALAMSPPLPC